ncbi:Outer membrane lipoprotein pcp [Chlamydiales bacterium SCGC AB-751-O23]|jgi:outer membrane lipoprotein SlyB|nr:Outer membrane lipoprotein pcp [Chlamydiales bacterium SCGC AB-751-O23]
MNKPNAALFITLLTACFFLNSCASEISSGTYSDAQVGETSSTYMGTIIATRNVTVSGNDKIEDNGTGIMTGAIAGGLGGSNMGKGHGNTTATVGGALLGAAAGAFAEKKLKEQKGIEYVIKLESGTLKTVVQGPSSPIAVGQKVLLMEGNQGRSRVVAYNP